MSGGAPRCWISSVEGECLALHPVDLRGKECLWRVQNRHPKEHGATRWRKLGHAREEHVTDAVPAEHDHDGSFPNLRRVGMPACGGSPSVTLRRFVQDKVRETQRVDAGRSATPTPHPRAAPERSEPPELARELGISKQRLSAILAEVPRDELDAALAGKVRCPHCGLWVAPHEAGHPRRS